MSVWAIRYFSEGDKNVVGGIQPKWDGEICCFME